MLVATLMPLLLILNFVQINSMGTEARLRKALLIDYDKWARPVMNFTTPVNLTFSAALYQHLGFDVKAETLKTLLWQRLTWYDELMRWDPAHYDNIHEARFSFNDIWVPDLLPYNDIGEYDASKFQSNLPLSVTNEGIVSWMTPILMETTCRMDVRKFPFDQQVCDITFGPWQYSLKEMDIDCLEHNIDISNYSQNSQWLLLGVTCCKTIASYPGGDFSAVHLSMTFQRLSGFFTRNLIIPNAVLLALSGLTFFLPNEAGERIGYGVTITLAICVNLSIVIQFVPESSYTIPNVCNYFLLSVFSSALTILFSTISLAVDLRKRKKIQCLFSWLGSSFKSVKSSLKRKIQKGRKKVSTAWAAANKEPSKSYKVSCTQTNGLHAVNTTGTNSPTVNENGRGPTVYRFDLCVGILYVMATTVMSVVFICDTGSTFGHV